MVYESSRETAGTKQTNRKAKKAEEKGAAVRETRENSRAEEHQGLGAVRGRRVCVLEAPRSLHGADLGQATEKNIKESPRTQTTLF